MGKLKIPKTSIKKQREEITEIMLLTPIFVILLLLTIMYSENLKDACEENANYRNELKNYQNVYDANYLDNERLNQLINEQK